MAAVNIAERVSKREQREQRDADLAKRDAEHGGMRSLDVEVAEQQRRESMRGWRDAYRPDVKWSEIRDARAGIVRDDPRRVTIQRLWIDCGAAVRRFAPSFKRDRGMTLRGDALLLLVRWERHGSAAPLDLGGENGMPLRRDWLEPTGADSGPREKLTSAAWRALHAAVKQAARSPLTRAETEQDAAEIATDPLDIAAQVEQQQRDADAATRLPDSAAPELLAQYLDLTLDAARAIVARAYPAASLRDLAESWGIGEQSAANALSRGEKRVRERYPDPADLLAALDVAASAYRADIAADVTLALLDWRDASEIAEQDVQRAVADWRDVFGALSPERRALHVAAYRAEQRAARQERRAYRPERAEHIAESVARLLPAEARRMRRVASLTARGNGR